MDDAFLKVKKNEFDDKKGTSECDKFDKVCEVFKLCILIQQAPFEKENDTGRTFRNS